MKRNIAVAVFMVLALGACANTPVTTSLTPAQQAQALANQQTQQYQECLVYKASQPLIAQKVATLPIAQATTLYDASVQATKYCGTVFTNTSSQAASLASALTTIALEAGINYAVQPGGAK
ncbi:MAG: hypothetical protein ACYCY2_02395 [Acidithiobacillus ferriphilus]